MYTYGTDPIHDRVGTGSTFADGIETISIDRRI